MKQHTYDPDEGEFVDFATLDDWRERDIAKDTALREMAAAHKFMVERLQAEINEADRRAGAAWRLLRRYKKRVRQLTGQDYE